MLDWKILQQLALKSVNEFQPDVIGLSLMFNMGHQNLIELAKFLKASFPQIPIIAGGVHASLSSSTVLEDAPEIDFILLHEAEYSIRQLFEIASQESVDHVKNISIATKIGNEYLGRSSKSGVTTLSFTPDYKKIPIGEYSKVGRIGAYTFLRSEESVASAVLSRRGCRAKCSFCSVRSFNGKGVSKRSYTDVVDEIAQLKNRYNVSHIMWLDDDLFFDNDDSIKLFRELASRKLGITWDASNGIIAAALNVELLDACVSSGCVGFNIGIESGNPEILRSMQKPGTRQKFIEAAELLEKYPEIFTKGFLIIGYPGETIGQLRDTQSLALQMKLDWYPSQILTPMPGTPVHQILMNQDMAGGIAEVLEISESPGKGRTFEVGVLGTLRKREMREKNEKRPFIDLLKLGDENQVPTREQLQDIYISMDYSINYEPILNINDKSKLIKKSKMLEEIATRLTIDNPLGTLFYAICLKKLGKKEESHKYFEISERYLQESLFWQARYDALEINKVREEFKVASVEM
jgi:tRNA A37 methylthiotransferase MiaB